MKELITNHFFNYEFVYVFLFCGLIFLFVSIFARKNIIKKILLFLFSMFFSLFCFEFGLSFFVPAFKVNPDYRYMSHYDRNNIKIQRQVHFVPKLDAMDGLDICEEQKATPEDAYLSKDMNSYKWEKDVDVNKFNDYIFVFDKTYFCYDNNFRFTKCDISSEESYVFLGCSYVFGYGLNNDETLPYYFSKLFDFKVNVINCGVQAKSTNSALNILNNDIFLPLINKNSKIKYFFCSVMEYWPHRNFWTAKYEGFDGYLYKNNNVYIPTIVGKIKFVFEKSYIFRRIFIPIIDEKFKQYYEDYMVQSLEEINKIVQEKYKSKLIVLVWDKEKYSETTVKKLKETTLDLIFLPDYFDFINSQDEGYRIKYDGHPTAKANEEIAQILYEHINKDNK